MSGTPAFYGTANNLLFLPSPILRLMGFFRYVCGYFFQVPRLIADLHTALGRGVSTSEAKAWVRALDRLGEGLESEDLLEACLVSAVWVRTGV